MFVRPSLCAILFVLSASCASSPSAVGSPSSSGAAPAPASPASASPAAAVDALLNADRAFAAASARTDVVSGLTAMFADGVIMPAPPGVWIEGAQKAAETLRANPDNAGARAQWTPVRGGVSADNQHGFTFGYMTVKRADGTNLPLKYLAYWVRESKGWRVAAYKRSRRPDGDASLMQLPPAVPPALVRAVRDTGVIAAFERSLRDAEQAFSDEAQRIGLGPAFKKYGSSDAMNMGPGPTFVIGAEQIGGLIGGPDQPATSPVNWKSDRVLVSSSGDLGVSFGMIRNNANPAAPAAPFFTIWRRARPTDAWRYVAE